MSNTELCDEETYIEIKLAKYAEELYNELCSRVRPSQRVHVTPPNILLENAINYLEG